MLQQTTVATVIPYFERFVSLFPSVEALAAAPVEAVLSAWAGLGYYARGRNLHACARQIVACGGFPCDVNGLRELPGIGAYTAAAVAAIAFGLPVVAVDGNVERVIARFRAIDQPLPGAKPMLASEAVALAELPAFRARPADGLQALFDLGATICAPAAPKCLVCPWQPGCAGAAAGVAASLPRKIAKAKRPERYGIVFRLTDPAGTLAVRTRPPRGLLGGMQELPGTPWRDTPWTLAEARAHAPVKARWRESGTVRHVFTHFGLTLTVYSAEAPALPPDLAPTRHAALPTVFRKCRDLP
jgi:A/G-specific adenine glycosylase